MLQISVPSHHQAEVRWVCEVIFSDFLKIPFAYESTSGDGYRLEFEDKALVIADTFFSSPESTWTKASSIPSGTLELLDTSALNLEARATSITVPVLFGRPTLDIRPQSILLGIDIFGSLFFMLSRYEEVVLPQRDTHNRFPAAASLAYREGFLDRPIVDEYIEILWACMKHLWPNLWRSEREGRLFVTCDVDEPYDTTLKTPAKVIKRVTGDLLRRRSPVEALRSMHNATARWRGDWSHDPNNTFDWMMTTCEGASQQIGFFFIAERNSAVDGDYTLTEPFIQGLLSRIDDRGHTIGMHGSYNSYRDPAQLKRERFGLQRACERAGAHQTITGNRQHYLRWDSAQSPACLEEAGVQFDSTGAYADAAGFRYGTAHSFHMWDWKNGRASALRQRPLIVMESSVMDAVYEGLGRSEAALEKMLELKRRSLKYGGEFVLLWHNSSLTTEEDRWIFRQLIGSV